MIARSLILASALLAAYAEAYALYRSVYFHLLPVFAQAAQRPTSP